MAEIEDSIQKIWPINPVEIEPTAIIYNWSVIEVSFKNNDEKTCHLIGDVPEQFGRATSAIQNYNRQTKTITTRSGRMYKLIGGAGYSDDADYVWQNWKKTNDVTSEKNVSEDYA